MLLRFVLCLAPAILAILLLFVGEAVGMSQDICVSIAIILIGAGAIISGICVGQKVYKAMKDPKWAAWVLAVITFLCVGVAYLGIGLAGCCGMALATS
ncbi:MAG: hypothetical protein CMO55_05120 [Verrucomicrobiales bacterium]|nr:hypothetical protein [Verrucomicrobiales bacterium]